MIVEGFKILEGTAWSASTRNANDLSQFKSMFIVLPSYVFTSEDNFKDESIWIQGIKDKNIFPIQNIKGVTPLTEETQYSKGEDQISILLRNGQYIYRVNTFGDFEYNKLLTQFSEQDITVIFADIHNNLYATSDDGTIIRGLSVNLLNVENNIIGDEKISYLPIYLELSEPNEINENGIVLKPDFKANKIQVVHLSITVTDEDLTYLLFSITDSQFDCPIDGLTVSDVTITDSVNGVLTGTLTQKGEGVYLFNNASDDIFLGTIEIETDNYIGESDYFVSDPIIQVDIFNVVVVSDTEITFSLRDSDTLSAITDLLVTEIELIDSIEGAITITNFTNQGSGNYRLYNLVPDVFDGALNIIGGRYGGLGDYQTLGVYTVGVSLSDSDINELTVTVFDGAQPINSLIGANFGISDNINTVTLFSVILIDNGTYRVITNGVRMDGTITVTNGGFSGNDDYEYTDREIRNSGSIGTNDWINPTDGTAEYWIGEGTLSIGNGSPFTGNYQILENEGDPINHILRAQLFGFKENQDYQLQFKYRTAGVVDVELYDYDTTTYLIQETVTDTVGAVQTYTSPTFNTGTYDILFVRFLVDTYPNTLDIDEVELIEV